MLDLVKKAFLAGLGAAVITKEKANSVLDKLVEEGKLSREEAGKLADDLVASGEKQWADLEASVNETLRGAADRLGMPGRGELEDLRRRVAALEVRVAALAGAGEAKPEP